MKATAYVSVVNWASNDLQLYVSPPSSLFLYSRLFPSGGLVCSHLLTLVSRALIFRPWRWRRYVPPKRRLTQDLHSAKFQKTFFRLMEVHKIQNTLKMEAVRSSETSVNPGYTQRHIPEDDIFHTNGSSQNTDWSSLQQRKIILVAVCFYLCLLPLKLSQKLGVRNIFSFFIIREWEGN
jgi:hypothetical protein